MNGEKEMNNERLKILTDALVKLAEYWTRAPSGEKSHAIYSQIDFLKKLIREECKK
jgi:hypothetical protein